MKSDTREWVRFAEQDYEAAGFLFRRRTGTATNIICFHSQQCVEKYLKARLLEAGLNIPKTHDLMLLLQRLLPVEPLWASFAPVLRGLNDYAVKFRYPGTVATRPETRLALKTCRSVRGEVRLSLGLPRK